jgi:hypothetical protein
MNHYIAKSNRLRISRFVFVLFVTVLVLVSVIVPTSAVSAHSPLFPGENHSPGTAYQINDPAKSWAIYNTLDHPDKGDYYSFKMSSGNKIDVSLNLPQSPSKNGFMPSFVLMIPGSSQKAILPSYIEIPSNYGTIVVNGTDPGKATYEPFSPGWYYEISSLVMNAPSEGVYYVVVFDYDQQTGNYGLPIGYVETFTILDWILIPYDVRTTYSWEGQNQIIVLLPVIVTLILGGLWFYWRNKKGEDPKSLSKWTAAFAGAFFLSSAINVMYQIFLALSVTGFTNEAFITLMFAIISITFSIIIFLYALRGKSAKTHKWTILLFVIGVAGLFTWSGLYFGTILLFISAILSNSSKQQVV